MQKKKNEPLSKRALLQGDEANFRALYRSYRKSATKRKLPFELSADRFREITKLPCLICGEEPSQAYRHDHRSSYKVAYQFNGIDRVSNSVGYIEGNCAPCCKKCNYAKGKGTLEDLLLYIHRAYQYAIQPIMNEEPPDGEEE